MRRAGPCARPASSPPRRARWSIPAIRAATNWYNPSFSPRTGLFYIPTWENSSIDLCQGRGTARIPRRQELHRRLSPRPARTATTSTAPSAPSIRRPARRSGTTAWPRLRTEAGILTTASDVLFSGGRDGAFYALDARDGKLLWETNLGPSGLGGADDLYGQRQAVRQHPGGKRFVHLRAEVVSTKGESFT